MCVVRLLCKVCVVCVCVVGLLCEVCVVCVCSRAVV